jgi:hypothetical protein
VRGRAAQFTEFVTERGPALWRTASLLEPDATSAEADLVAALARTRRRWSSVSADDRAEAFARESLYREVVDRNRRDDTLDDEALSRLALVLMTYDGVTAAEAAALLRLSPEDVARHRARGERTMRDLHGTEASTPLLSVLNAAASDETPPELAGRAASVRRQVRYRPLVATLAVVAAAAVVLAAAPWSRDVSDADRTPGVSALGMPTALSTAHNLATLAEEPIESASTAYVVGGVPIVTDAASGAGRLVFERDPGPEWLDDSVPGPPRSLRRGQWTQSVLSPDGRWLVLVQALQEVKGESSSQTFLVDLATATPLLLGDVATQPRARGPGGVALTRVAWSPESDGFACVCGRTLSIAKIHANGGDFTVSVDRTDIRADAVSGGLAGLAVRDPRRGWWIVNRPSAVRETLTHANALAMTYYNRVLFLTADAATFHSLGSDSDVDGGQCALWDAEFTDPIPIEPFPDRDAWLCTPMTMQSGRDGIVLVVKDFTRTERERGAVDAVYVRDGGGITELGRFPARTTAASIAAQLVG